jgi:hypothetical protein
MTEGVGGWEWEAGGRWWCQPLTSDGPSPPATSSHTHTHLQRLADDAWAYVVQQQPPSNASTAQGRAAEAAVELAAEQRQRRPWQTAAMLALVLPIGAAHAGLGAAASWRLSSTAPCAERRCNASGCPFVLLHGHGCATRARGTHTMHSPRGKLPYSQTDGIIVGVPAVQPTSACAGPQRRHHRDTSSILKSSWPHATFSTVASAG